MRGTYIGPLAHLKGKTQSLAAWCEELHLNYNRTHGRLTKLGWPVQKAFSQ